MDPSPWPDILGVIGTLCVVAAFWSMVVFVISRLGWSAFARQYATAGKPAGRAFLSSQANFGFPLATYRNVLYVTFLPEGLYVRAIFPFNIAHRPLLLPWGILVNAELKRTLLVFRFIVQLQSDAGRFRITLPMEAQKAFEAVRPAS